MQKNADLTSKRASDLQKIAIAIMLVKVLNDPMLVTRILQRRRAYALRFFVKNDILQVGFLKITHLSA